MSQQPEMRIGDREREAAVSALGEHYAAGRITKEEYDERATRAWAARTHSDLAPLFVDLPAARQQPPTSRATAPVRPRASRPSRPRVPVVWLVALAILLVVLFDGWAVPLLAVAALVWLARGFSHGGCHGRR